MAHLGACSRARSSYRAGANGRLFPRIPEVTLKRSPLLLLVSLALLTLSVGCQQEPVRTDLAPIKDLDVAQLVALRQQKGDAVVLLDANRDGFRKENGTLPGARLLSSYREYDVARELPADRATPLVFYCSSSL
jgi:hypothetical protein